jgi:hypothetical protein
LPTPWSVIFGLALGAALGGCSNALPDPVHDQGIAALGPEDPAVPVGERHRPGQPCVACHYPEGTALAFSFAGTVYRRNDAPDPFAGADVLLTDSAGQTFRARTNCAGNFFVTSRQYAPVFPVWTTVRSGMIGTDMESVIHRDGSCATCHADPSGPRSAGRVFVTDDPDVTLAATPPCPPGGR